MKLVPAVIFDHPDETLWDNISTYTDPVDALLLFDKTPKDNAKDLIEKSPKTRYFWNGKNEGIPKRFHTAIDCCAKKGYDYLLTMNQDFSFESGFPNKYISWIENLNVSDVGMYGVLHHTI